MSDSPIDVLIIGAGPTGLALAGEVAVHGAGVRVIEARADRLDQSRAIGVQPRTLELFGLRGFADDLVSRGGAVDRVVRHARHFRPAQVSLDTGVPDSRFRGMHFVSQVETEQVLESHLAACGTHLEREVTLVDLHQDEQLVTATLRHADGSEEQVRARYVVGADGAGSTVRNVLGIPFEGRSYRQSFVVADLDAEGPLARDALNIFISPTGEGMAGFMPLRGPAPWRLLTMEPEVVPEDAAHPTVDDLRATLDVLTGEPIRLANPVWINRFRIHLRSAARFRSGRVFLAGDAAHVHSPAGGQGMNTGIGDAWNLGWKLAMVAREEASPELLDSYEAERIPAAKTILDTTDRAFAAFASPKRATRLVRAWVIPAVTALVGSAPGISGRAARRFSQLDIAYRDSPAVDGTSDRLRPRPGDRLPDIVLSRGDRLHQQIAGAGHHLLVCDPCDPDRLGRLEREYARLITVRRLPDGTLGGGLVLVRPDGHVAFRSGTDVAPLERFLGRWLRLGAGSSPTRPPATA
jgi:2-polyprenyl-6-methoxyphenol hydroxylase-like FAD-dependent oxidoreductase